MIEQPRTFNLKRIAYLYKDLISPNMKAITPKDKELLLKLTPVNKVLAIGGVPSDNWNAYPLTYLLTNKLVTPSVLDESKIYQSWHAMRTVNKKIAHPQSLVRQCVVIRLMGYDVSPNINEYFNSFISMCQASDECKLIFVVVSCSKEHYRDNVYVRKTDSTFIDTSTGSPYEIHSIPLYIKPDDIVFFDEPQTVAKPVLRTKTSTKYKNLEFI